MDGVDIQPLTPDRLGDYLHFMDNDAFGGNPDWEGCYCREAHWEGTDSAAESATRDDNRDAVSRLVAGGGHTGLLAYEGGRVVGWCHAERLSLMQNQAFRRGRDDEELARVGGIVCFNLAESHRRLGLPGVLLREAVRRFAADGLAAAEAYPWKEPSPRPGRNYLGTVQLYELHGFTRAAETDDIVVMRRSL